MEDKLSRTDSSKILRDQEIDHEVECRGEADLFDDLDNFQVSQDSSNDSSNDNSNDNSNDSSYRVTQKDLYGVTPW